MKQTAEQRLWGRVDKNGPTPERRPDLGPCWLWTGCKKTGGYGAMWFNGYIQGAHRVAFLISGLLIPDGHHLDHLCKNKPCCNPSHMEPVTMLENFRRHWSEQTACKRAGHHLSTRGNGSRYCKMCHAADELKRYHKNRKHKQT